MEWYTWYLDSIDNECAATDRTIEQIVVLAKELEQIQNKHIKKL